MRWEGAANMARSASVWNNELHVDSESSSVEGPAVAEAEVTPARRLPNMSVSMLTGERILAEDDAPDTETEGVEEGSCSW